MSLTLSLPKFNFWRGDSALIYLLTKKVTVERENRIMDRTIKKLPADNDRDYIEHEEDSRTFKILGDPKQRQVN